MKSLTVKAKSYYNWSYPCAGPPIVSEGWKVKFIEWRFLGLRIWSKRYVYDTRNHNVKAAF